MQQRQTDRTITWTMRWVNRQPPDHAHQHANQHQGPTPLVIVIIDESWTLHWANDAETPPLPNATE